MSYLLKALQKAEEERKAINQNEADVSAPVVVSANLPWPLFALVGLLVLGTLWQLSGFNGSSTEHSVEDLAMETSVAGFEKSANESLNQSSNENTMAHKASDLKGLGSDINTNTNTNTQPQTNKKIIELQAGEELIEPSSTGNAQGVSDDSLLHAQTQATLQTSLQEPEVKQLEELSKETLQAIPSLQLESHIFSSAVEYRSVVINGRSFYQGQFINSDVVLQTITEDGIVINVADQLIALPKGISWVASNHAQ